MSANASSSRPSAARLALGSAQFGLDYGVSNTSGKVALEAVREILSIAAASGCDTIDTAVAYGDSEERLGVLGVQGWRIVSKLPAHAQAQPDLHGWARHEVEGSLRRLGVGCLDTLLLHAPAQLSGARGEALFSALARLREEGLVRRLGVSIYSPAELEALVPRFSIDVVQAPFNVLDRSLLTSGWASRLATLGVEVHIRSLFLQGLLLMSPQERPGHFSRWAPIWTAWDRWLLETGTDPLAACLGHALAQPWANKLVVGVASPVQLGQVVAACACEPVGVPEHLACDDPLLIHPSLWPR